MNNFCTHCGKSLAEGVTCDCQASGQPHTNAPPQQPPAQPFTGYQQPQGSGPVGAGQQTYYSPESQGAAVAKSSLKDLSAFAKTVFVNPIEAFHKLKETDNFVLAIICIVIKAFVLQATHSAFTLLHYIVKLDLAFLTTGQKFSVFGGTFLMSLIADIAIVGAIFLMARLFNNKTTFTQVLSVFGVISLSLAVFYFITTAISIPFGSIRFFSFFASLVRGISSGLHASLYFLALSAIFNKKEKNFFAAVIVSMCSIYVVSNIIGFLS